MRPPIEILAAIIILGTILQAIPDAGRLPLSASGTLASVAGLFAYWLAVGTYFRAAAAVVLRRADKTGWQAVAKLHGWSAAAGQVLLLAGYGAHLWWGRWPDVVLVTFRLDNVPVAPDILLLLPFICAMVAAWTGNWPLARRLTRAAPGRTWRLRDYLAHQARYGMAILIPWICYVALASMADFVPARLGYEPPSDEWRAAGSVLFLAALALVFVPAGLARLWGAGPMPDCAMRRRFAEMARAAGLKFRDVLVWRPARVPIYNAAIIGPWARFRYVLVSRDLIESLSEDESLAVLGHEMGHARHRHLTAFFFFAIGYALLCATAVLAMPANWQKSPWVVGGTALAFLVPYWRYGFGVLSRAMERQADLASAELMGSPFPLASALARISAMCGDARESRDWRHEAPARRIERLLTEGGNAEAVARFHRRIRRWLVAGGAVLAALACAAAYLAFGGPR
jgi:Zn-dependent protease with chaperone function